MLAYAGLRYVQLSGDLLVGAALGDKLENLALAARYRALDHLRASECHLAG